MNNRMIVYMIGRMLGVEGLLLLVPALVSFLYGEQSGIAFLLTAAILLIIFLLAGRKKPKDTSIYGKEGLALVGIAWILWSLFGALPFFISGSIPDYLDAFFETVLRIYNNRFYNSDGYRGASAGNVVLESADTLDRRNGSFGICYGTFESG